jgi:hypothetical protein
MTRRVMTVCRIFFARLRRRAEFTPQHSCGYGCSAKKISLPRGRPDGCRPGLRRPTFVTNEFFGLI